jgi:hypothetical protein
VKYVEEVLFTEKGPKLLNVLHDHDVMVYFVKNYLHEFIPFKIAEFVMDKCAILETKHVLKVDAFEYRCHGNDENAKKHMFILKREMNSENLHKVAATPPWKRFKSGLPGDHKPKSGQSIFISVLQSKKSKTAS